MKRIKNINLLLILLLSVVIVSCFNKKDNSSREKGGQEKNVKSEKLPNENELQEGKGVNGDLPAPVDSYEEILNSARGIIPNGNPYTLYYSKDAEENTEMWKKAVIPELEKIGKIPDNVNDEGIDKVFRQFLYITGSKYPYVEGINSFSYVVFKKDMIDPILGNKIYENRKLNVEIVLDASISMNRKIGNESMMDIAKYSINKFVERLPEGSNVALRVFGHKGNGNADGKGVSCASNELIQPMEKLDKEKINGALGNVKPAGWTSIADSIEKGSNDLKGFKEEENINILYIITDGIETCGKNLEEVAKKFKAENKNIIFKIIAFNVNPEQSRILKKTAGIAGGRYSLVYDARNLIYELLKTHELKYTKFKWITLNRELLEKLKRNYELAIRWQEISRNEFATEKKAMIDLINVASNKDGKGMPNPIITSPEVRSKLVAMAAERGSNIQKLYNTEIMIRQIQVEKYLSKLKEYIGDEVAYIEANSRYTPNSEYLNDYK